jgi:hypothetical protein
VNVSYLLFAFEKDNHSMRLIENESQVLRDLEGIDIEGDEYVFWDSNGAGVSIAVSVGAFKSKLRSVTSSSPVFPLKDALKLYAESLGIQEAVGEGAPMDVWRRIQTGLAGLPKKQGFLARLFSGKG